MAVYLPLLIGSLVLFLVSYLLGSAERKGRHEKYSILTFFPYELYGDSRSPRLLASRILEVLSLLCPIAGCAYYLSSLSSEGWGSMGFPFAILAGSFLSSAALLFLTIVPAGRPKEHVALFFLADASSLLTLAMGGLYSINAWIYQEPVLPGLTLAFAILLFIASVFLLLLLLNPRLTHWADMKKVSQPDGTYSLERPRPFVLAFSEWILIFVYLVFSAVLLASFIIL